jgi:hypothetical protein
METVKTKTIEMNCGFMTGMRRIVADSGISGLYKVSLFAYHHHFAYKVGLLIFLQGVGRYDDETSFKPRVAFHVHG